jgi:hypothetical protein
MTHFGEKHSSRVGSGLTGNYPSVGEKILSLTSKKAKEKRILALTLFSTLIIGRHETHSGLHTALGFGRGHPCYLPSTAYE